jgi:hypothetical protein
MADNAQKTPYGRYINEFAQKKILSAIQKLGKNLPCSVIAVSGSIVTVKFEVQSGFTLPSVTMPMFGPEYIRYPTQIGDLGVTVAADTYLGGISALGGGVADLSLRANLSMLLFLPVASKNWSPTDNPNAVVIYGPDGAVIRDTGNACSIVLTPSGIAIKGNVTVTGDVTAGFGTGDSVTLQDHKHTNTQPGGGQSGPPAPGT